MSHEASGNGGEEAEMKTSEAESKLEEGTVEAESSIREGGSLNFEEARALLGRLEYQKGNVEAALRVFEAIDLLAAIQRLQSSLSEKPASRRSRSRTDSMQSESQHAATPVLEAIYLKAMCLQKLGRAKEAAKECTIILDSMEKMFQNSLPDMSVEQKLQEIVSMSVELLPELWKQAGNYQETFASYRRALLNQWNLDEECSARIQKRFAMFLLYDGIEASRPNLTSQADGSFVPRNNLEEAILLLIIVLKKYCLGKVPLDPSIMEHLTFALSISNQTMVLARQFEAVLPGVYPRCERWFSLALCYSGTAHNQHALNLLRKVLNRHENPNNIMALLLAAKNCSEDCNLASEGAEYARRAIPNAQTVNEHLKGVAFRFLGVCLGKQAKIASSDHERSRLQTEALKALDEAITLERQNPDILFDLGLEYAEQRNTNAALQCAKQFIDATGGSISKGWRLLALVLSAQRRYSEAEVIIDAALDETAKWEQGPLIRMKAKLKVTQSLPMDAVESYRFLLALVQAERKSSGSTKKSQTDDEKVSGEFDVWQGLANLYSSLSHWKDAEICLDKAKALRPYSAAVLNTEGTIHEARGQTGAALTSYSNALSIDLDHAPCMISIGALLSKKGVKALPVARSFLSDALRLEPTNRLAWYYLGMIHRDDGKLTEAADCFQAASMLDESNPIESFSCIS